MCQNRGTPKKPSEFPVNQNEKEASKRRHIRWLSMAPDVWLGVRLPLPGSNGSPRARMPVARFFDPGPRRGRGWGVTGYETEHTAWMALKGTGLLMLRQ